MTRVDAIAQALADALAIVDLNADWQAIARPLALVALGALAEHDRGERAHAGARAIASIGTASTASTGVVDQAAVERIETHVRDLATHGVRKPATVEPSATAPVTTAEGVGSSPSATEREDVAVDDAPAAAPLARPSSANRKRPSGDDLLAVLRRVDPNVGLGRELQRLTGCTSVKDMTDEAVERGWLVRGGRGQTPTITLPPVVVPARERPEKPVVLPAPPDTEPDKIAATTPPTQAVASDDASDDVDTAAATSWACEHCGKGFASLSACAGHETTCGRTGSHVAPLPTAGLVIRCLECDDFVVDAHADKAEAQLARHTRSEHGRFPTKAEQSKRSAA